MKTPSIKIQARYMQIFTKDVMFSVVLIGGGGGDWGGDWGAVHCIMG